ncbi:MAG TPA: TadE family protein [bacterium]|nr:TadE family protein [bacterium]
MSQMLNAMRRRAARGNNLLEFAMITPLLLTLFMGVFDFGWILHQQIALDNATREGARRGAVGMSDDAIRAKIDEMVEFDVDPDQISIEVVDADGNAQPAGSRTPDDMIIVSIDVPDVELVTPIRNFVDTIGTIDLHSEAQFRIE